jgi:hypothetical protein
VGGVLFDGGDVILVRVVDLLEMGDVCGDGAVDFGDGIYIRW